MRRDELTPEARRQLTIATEQLHAAGIAIDEDAILKAAMKPIVIGPRAPHADKLSKLLAGSSAHLAPRNRHERRRAAALLRRS